MTIALQLPRLRPDQLEIVKHPARVKYLECGRRWGKSVLGGVVATNVLRQHGTCAWVVPTFKNSRPLWRWVRNVVSPLPNYFKVNEAERTIETHLGGLLELHSADNVDAIRGNHYHLVVVDEAARVSQEAVQEAIEPCLADYSGEELLISTPKGINWFSEGWDMARAAMNNEFAAWRKPSCDNPIPGIRRAYERARDMLPERSFAQEWDALPTAPGGAVFKREWFSPRYTGKPISVGRYISWDTSLKEKETDDFHAYTIADLSPDYRLHITEVSENHCSFPELTDQIVQVATRHNIDEKIRGILIEDKGSGTSALQTLRATAPEWMRGLLFEYNPRMDKVARGNQAAIWCKTGCVLLPAPAPELIWLYDFEKELFNFPEVLHDDRTDSFTQLILYLENILEEGYRARSYNVNRN